MKFPTVPIENLGGKIIFSDDPFYALQNQPTQANTFSFEEIYRDAVFQMCKFMWSVRARKLARRLLKRKHSSFPAVELEQALYTEEQMR